MTEPTIERKLAIVAANDLLRRERRTARALLRTERLAIRRLRDLVRRASESVAANVAIGADAVAQVRRQLPGLQGALQETTLRVQLEARAAGRGQLGQELGRVLPSASGTLVIDDAASALGAASLTSAWGSSSLAAAIDKASARAIMSVADSLEGRVARVAVTETARAFNDERHRIIIELGGGEDETGAPPDRQEPAPGVFKVWSAFLDAKTCPRCFQADGEIVEAHKSFKAGVPPLHPHCRCTVEHLIVQKPERLEDIAIDYDLFKQEVADVIREKRIESDQHALRFAAESLGSKRSPVTLTKRFVDEPYATRR